MGRSSEINWPDFDHPENCTIHVRNQLDVDASPSSVWACLVDATRWPDWYLHASDVVMLEEAGATLQFNSRFRWKTMPNLPSGLRSA